MITNPFTRHTINAFCSTGTGGGIDPSCSPGSSIVSKWAAKRFKDPAHAKAFVEWFGDSKVVDENGEPMMVYHGTKGKDFDEFWTTENYDFGAHFGNLDQASLFNDQGNSGSRTYPVYLNIENPIRLPDLGGWDWSTVTKALKEKGIEVPPEVENERLQQKPGKEYQKWAMGKLQGIIENSGYDGIIYLNAAEGVDHTALSRERMKRMTSFGDNPVIPDDVMRGLGATDSWISLRPTQIKSATSNRGTYDRSNARINNQRGVS